MTKNSNQGGGSCFKRNISAVLGLWQVGIKVCASQPDNHSVKCIDNQMSGLHAKILMKYEQPQRIVCKRPVQGVSCSFRAWSHCGRFFIMICRGRSGRDRKNLQRGHTTFSVSRWSALAAATACTWKYSVCLSVLLFSRWSPSVSCSLSLVFSVSLPLPLAITVSIRLAISQSLSLVVCHSLSLQLCVRLSLSLSLSLYLSISISISLSLSLSYPFKTYPVGPSTMWTYRWSSRQRQMSACVVGQMIYGAIPREFSTSFSPRTFQRSLACKSSRL